MAHLTTQQCIQVHSQAVLYSLATAARLQEGFCCNCWCMQMQCIVRSFVTYMLATNEVLMVWHMLYICVDPALHEIGFLIVLLRGDIC